ncbi:virulence factor TspB C-terminal domain-related protein [Acidovorax sp. FG27]|uniref:virulence factor TspB C-terminal domain-related protein n=1 Tax=Acidovorax sp. FG27 TaxID=3133652 RepID=UPI0030E7D408
MDLLRTLVAIAALAAGTAHAGYAQLASPSGFTTSSYGWGYAAASNDAAFGRVLHQPNGLTASVGGQAVKMPAAYRLAANAPRVAAAVIFANPALRTAAGIASWLGLGKVVWDAVEEVWKEVSPAADGYAYSVIGAGREVWTTSPASACQAWIADNPGSDTVVRAYVSNTATRCVHATYNKKTGEKLGEGEVTIGSRSQGPIGCPAGWTFSPAGCLSPALQQPQFVELLNPANQPGWPMPDSVPLELPRPTTLPVEQPFINPSPGPNPAHRPQFIPTGNPVRNPNYDPSAAPGPNNSPWLQPGVRMVPSPTPAEPFRVDYQPVNRPVDSPNPNPEPSPDGEDNPDDKPNPEDQPSLCEKHPDIVACQKLGDLTPETLKTRTVTLDLKREDGFGPANGSCPAPKEFAVLGKTMAFRWDLLCDFASAIRPLLIGFAYLSAALAFMGLSRKD